MYIKLLRDRQWTRIEKILEKINAGSTYQSRGETFSLAQPPEDAGDGRGPPPVGDRAVFKALLYLIAGNKTWSELNYKVLEYPKKTTCRKYLRRWMDTSIVIKLNVRERFDARIRRAKKKWHKRMAESFRKMEKSRERSGRPFLPQTRLFEYCLWDLICETFARSLLAEGRKLWQRIVLERYGRAADKVESIPGWRLTEDGKFYVPASMRRVGIEEMKWTFLAHFLNHMRSRMYKSKQWGAGMRSRNMPKSIRKMREE